MATTLSLTDDTLTFNMYSGNFYLAAEGWEAEFTADEKWEVFPLKSKAAEATIRTDLKTLDTLVENARVYSSNGLEYNAVWLNYASPTETAKRAIVYEITYTMRSQGRMGPLLVVSGAFVDVSVRHGPWETTSSSFTETLTASGAASGVDGLATSVMTNTLRGRVSNLSFSCSVCNEFWIGLRDFRHGSTGFEPFWECELGTEGRDTIETAVANARGGKVARCDFASFNADCLPRITVKWSDVAGAGDQNDIIGDYLVLVRVLAQNNSAIFQIRGETSGSAMTNSIAFGEQWWTAPVGGYYFTIPLGRVTFPLGANRGNVLSATLGYQQIVISAKRVGGTGYLDFDTIILIPLDHFAYLYSGATSPSSVAIKATEDDQYVAIINGSSVAPVTAINWNFPVGRFHWVFASGHRSAGVATNSGTVTSLSMTGYNRYGSFT